jgi:hypothetical protein
LEESQRAQADLELRRQQEARIAEQQSRLFAASEAERARVAARQATQDAQADEDRRRERSHQQNQVGVRQMMTERLTQGPLDRETAEQMSVMGWSEGVGVPGVIARAAEPPSRTVVRSRDERGRPIRRAYTDDELAAGVPEYVDPERPEFEWVLRNGDPVQIRRGTARQGDRPYDEVAARGGGGGSDYGRFLQRWANEHGLDVNRLTATQELEARRQYSEAGRDSLFGLDDDDVGTAPGAAPAPAGRGAGPGAGAGRTATTADVQTVAQRAGISEAEARRRLEAAGVVIR